MISLVDIKIDQKATIVDIIGDNSIVQLTELGFIPNQEVTLVRKGPFGSPLCFQIGGCLIALRKDQAQMIKVLLS